MQQPRETNEGQRGGDLTAATLQPSYYISVQQITRKDRKEDDRKGTKGRAITVQQRNGWGEGVNQSLLVLRIH